MKKLGPSGMSLTEVMLALAIGVVVTAAAGTTIYRIFLAQRHAEYKDNATKMISDIRNLLSNRSSCFRSFGGVNATTGLPQKTQILTATGAVYRQSSPVAAPIFYENNTIRIARFFFQTNPTSTYVPSGSNPLFGRVELSVELQSPGLLGMASNNFFTIPLSVELNAARNIVSCVSLGSDENSIWKLSGNKAYYNEGLNVGVGTDDPSRSLDVAGNMNSSSQISASRLEAPLLTTEVSPGVYGNIMAGDARADDFKYTSDRRLKNNIHRFFKSDRILKLSPVFFKWKTSQEKALGFEAQGLAKVFPSIVEFSQEDQLHRIDYSQLIAVVVEEYKNLQRQQSKLKDQIQKLEKRLEVQ